MSIQYQNCGSVNEAGYLANIFKKGYTISLCMSELLANSSDANSSEARFEIIKNDTIKLIDDGDGLDIQDIDRMYEMNRSNHIGDRSKGVSGLGGKAAQIIGGNKTDVVMYTHKRGCKWIRVNAPWKSIYSEGVYTGKISKTEMTEDEIRVFKNERPQQNVDGSDNSYQGTTIVFQYNNQLRAAIASGMDKENDRDGIAADQTTLFGFVFGLDDIRISLSYPDRPDKPIMYCKKYTYFGANDDSYYCGKTAHDITHWQKIFPGEHAQSRFTYMKTEDPHTLVEYPIKANGYAKKERPVTVEELEGDGFVNVGTFKFECGLRKDINHFNSASPKDLVNIEYVGDYDTEHLVGKNGEIYKYVGYCAMFARNQQILGSFQYPDIQTSSYRSNMEARYVSYVHGILSYVQESSPNNPNDKLANVQENKNQWNTVLPSGLSRICHSIRQHKAKEIWIYMNDLIRLRRPILPAAPGNEAGNVADGPHPPGNEAGNVADGPHPPGNEAGNVADGPAVSSALAAIQAYTSDDEDGAILSNAAGGSGNTTDEGRDSSSDNEPPAINVISHRRGKVTKAELSEMLLKLNEKILAAPNEFYTDENSLKIFNLISAKI